MSNGWAVHVKGRGEESSETYYARVPDRIGAVVRRAGAYCPKGDVVIEARAPVQSTVFDALKNPRRKSRS
jgi:hypothetical protein